MLLDQLVDFRHGSRRGEARHVAHRGPHQNRKKGLIHGLQGAPGEQRENEVVIVERILGNSHAQQEVERFDRRDIVLQPQEEMISPVGFAPIDRGEEGRLGRLDSAGIHRREFQ